VRRVPTGQMERLDGLYSRLILELYQVEPSVRARTHTRERVWMHVHRLRLAEHRACVHAYVRTCVLAPPCSISRVRVWSILRSPPRIASIDIPQGKREVSVKPRRQYLSPLWTNSVIKKIISGARNLSRGRGKGGFSNRLQIYGWSPLFRNV